MEIDNILILPHAIGRFQKRYEALNHVTLEGQALMNRLQDLIMNAKPEEDGLILQKRRDAHGGIGKYLINLPWRFVFSNVGLETCEIVPENVTVVENPKIPQFLERTRFFVRIEEDAKFLTTTIINLSNEREFCLKGPPEINAIIRCLRAIGVEINYKRMGDKAQKIARLEIVVPIHLYPYEIEQVANSRKIRIFLNRNNLFTLGLKRIACVGITEKELKRILRFLRINKS